MDDVMDNCSFLKRQVMDHHRIISLSELNTLCQRFGWKPEWKFDEAGPPHDKRYMATLTLCDWVVSGHWVQTKAEAKKSAVSAFDECIKNTEQPNENSQIVQESHRTLILADVDNSLDLVVRMKAKNDASMLAVFCGRSFNGQHPVLAGASVYRALSAVKNAADMAMSFHAAGIVQRAADQGVRRVAIVSRDAALEELAAQLRESFQDVEFEVVSF